MMNRLSALARAYLVAVTALVGVFTGGIGIWCLIEPASFARVVGFETHLHFLHDVGAFQLGLGVALLLALIWADALATALAGFIVADTVHAVNHITDLDLGGSVAQAWVLGAVSVALVAGVSGGGGANLATSWAPWAPQPIRRWHHSSGRKPSASPPFARTARPAPVRSALRWTAIAPTFAVSSGRSKCAGFNVTRWSNFLVRRPDQASRRDRYNLATFACWMGLSIGRRDVCYGRSIHCCMGCWCPWRTDSCGPSSVARYTRS